MKTYRLYDYDVWGNEKEGYTVNDCFRSCQTIDLDESWDDARIIKALKHAGIIKKGIRAKSIRIDGEMDYTLYFEYKDRPEFELRRENV